MADKIKPEILDFSQVKDRGRYNPKRVKAGPYKAKVVGVVRDTSNKDDTKMWVYEVHLLGVKRSGSYPYYCKLTENQMWKIRNLLTAAGLKVPKKKVKVDPEKVVNKTIGVEMEDDEYEGKQKSVIADVYPASDVDDTDLPDADDDDEEVEEDEDEEEVDEDDLEEIEIDEV